MCTDVNYWWTLAEDLARINCNDSDRSKNTCTFQPTINFTGKVVQCLVLPDNVVANCTLDIRHRKLLKLNSPNYG
jgi:hypothetical protein